MLVLCAWRSTAVEGSNGGIELASKRSTKRRHTAYIHIIFCQFDGGGGFSFKLHKKFHENEVHTLLRLLVFYVTRSQAS